MLGECQARAAGRRPPSLDAERPARLRKRGAQLVSNEVVQYEDSYRLCYIRGPEGLLIGLAEQIR